MPALETGRVCVKLRGREAGRKAVIVEAGKGGVVIEGPHVRRRKVNPLHLLLTPEKAKASEFAFKGKAKVEKKPKPKKG
ncbi:MAG TPA: 50S ribosomal protein L14e [Candidatus Diapherotrites archaeon]|uniref:50S ribosomal protein L14e n=1 Tax=Candidatus Iainarchaeum sp. TaxID=3101447 RepID=A0A7J4JFF5_9ARCH|nr:50S ribosomal protein L14e [Candidatus Diapherotrites archaeon]HIH16511.1 50S ribosomal protein L14e [Candidatus Diapherotrites archaeon]